MHACMSAEGTELNPPRAETPVDELEDRKEGRKEGSEVKKRSERRKEAMKE